MDKQENPDGTLISRLAELAPQLNSVDRLEATIQNARDGYPHEQLAELAADICACPGEAAQRIRREVYDCLRLTRIPG